MKLISSLILCLLANSSFAASMHEQGLVLSNPVTVKALEKKGFSLNDLLTQPVMNDYLANREMAEIPVLKPVLENLRQEIKIFAAKGGGRPFDANYLVNPRARFALVGVINRMDRGYHSGDRCGEIRFIFRLSYNVIDHEKETASRLPMTINLIFNAGNDNSEAGCAEVARAWQRMTLESKSVDWITDGPLSAKFFKYENLKALEINLQVSRQGAAAPGKFGGRADYLLKVYEYENGTFKEGTLENEINRDALKKDPALLKELKTWLMDSQNAKAINDGTFVLPKKFLAKHAISIAPGGIARSSNRPYYGFFKEGEIKPDAFKNIDFDLIKSQDGFIRRLNDSTCTGCHQTRAIGGFHFTGMDPFGKYPGNSVFLPGSPHFMGDLSRRRAIVASVANAESSLDYSRGFSLRPQERRSQDLIGTGLLNGWSAPCSMGTDPTFKAWTCAEGLVCKKLLDVSDNVKMGTCLTEVQQVGSACEFGKVKNISFGVDEFKRLNEREVTVPNAMCSPQTQDPGTLTGGFLNGNVRKLSCEDKEGEVGLPPEAACGLFPAAKPGFNRCAASRNHQDCLKEFSIPVGQKACDALNPCRDDYICGESLEKTRGVCLPPYFLFQFRVDGHPKGDK